MNPALFKNLSDDEFKDVFAYLRTVPAVKHRVDDTEPPTLCRIAARNMEEESRTEA